MREVEGSDAEENINNDYQHHASPPTMRDVEGGSANHNNNRQRYLQEGNNAVCPDRTTSCPETADFCLFGCMRATTMDCGSSFVGLGPEIGAALGRLELDCLGAPNEPVVEVTIFR